MESVSDGVCEQFQLARGLCFMHGAGMWTRFALLVLSILLGGCAAAPLLPTATSMLNGPANADFHSGTTIHLERANFVTVKTNVVGQARGWSLFGVLTMSPARLGTAMDRLYSGAEMQAGRPQTLANVIVERSSSFYILFSVPRVTVRGDVVEFVPVRRDEPSANGRQP